MSMMPETARDMTTICRGLGRTWCGCKLVWKQYCCCCFIFKSEMSCIAHKCQAQVFHECMIHCKYDAKAQELGEKLWSLDSQWRFESNHNWPTYIIHQTRVLSTQLLYPCHCHNLAGDTPNTPCHWPHYICLWLALVLPNSSLLPLHFQFPLASWRRLKGRIFNIYILHLPDVASLAATQPDKHSHGQHITRIIVTWCPKSFCSVSSQLVLVELWVTQCNPSSLGFHTCQLPL